VYRPPLEYAEPLEKGTCKPLRPYFDGLRDYMSLFEDTPPPPKPVMEKAEEKKERLRKEKLVKHLLA
jgi:U1 small nuclear ribonucleoprotein of 70kDa MW N terminal